MKLREMRYDSDKPIINYGEKAQQIRYWLNRTAKIPDGKFSFNKDLSVDVHGDVRLMMTLQNKKTGEPATKWSHIPIQFNKVDGDFIMQDGEVTSMAGAPRIVGGRFNMSNQRLSSWEHMPQQIGIHDDVNKGAWLFGNKFTNLHNIHKYCQHMKGVLMLDENPIESHVLGVLLIKGLTRLRMGGDARFARLSFVCQIINKHLANGRDVIACQDELIDSDLEDFAKL